MKKIQVLALGAIAALAVSCNGGGGNISTDVKLNTPNDTLAYAYGVEVASQGLTQYLSQLGVLVDTAQYRYSQTMRIQSEQDSAKRLDIIKKISFEVDSIAKANEKNMGQFLSGLQDAMNAPESKAAYYRGLEIGGQLSQMSGNVSKQVFGEDSKETISKDMMLAGVVTILKKQQPKIENSAAIFQSKMEKAQEERMKAQYSGNIEAGQKFLEENKAKEGVQVLPSGLQYKVEKEGTGAKPAATDKVKVHYHGTLLDGTVFDSSVQRGEPASFGVTQVIPGWIEALQLMPVGSKWTIYVPENLAYGARQAGNIPPYSTLVFEIELLEIEKPAK